MITIMVADWMDFFKAKSYMQNTFCDAAFAAFFLQPHAFVSQFWISTLIPQRLFDDLRKKEKNKNNIKWPKTIKWIFGFNSNGNSHRLSYCCCCRRCQCAIKSISNRNNFSFHMGSTHGCLPMLPSETDDFSPCMCVSVCLCMYRNELQSPHMVCAI